MFIVWTEARDGEVKAERKKSKLAAVRAYNKITGADLKAYGWSVSEDAHPQVRRAVGLKPFLELGERDPLP